MEPDDDDMPSSYTPTITTIIEGILEDRRLDDWWGEDEPEDDKWIHRAGR